MISYHFNAEAYFVLGGRKGHLEKLMGKRQFVGASASGKIASILRLPGKYSIGLRLASPRRSRVKMLKKMFQDVGAYNLPIPEKIVCRDVAYFPLQCKKANYQVYAWEIKHAATRRTFTPAEHRLYK